MRRRVLVAAGVLALLAGLLAAVVPGVATATDSTLLRARLNGANEVPGPGDPDGFGQAFVRLSSDRVCFALEWSDIGQPTRGHIHFAAVGVAGPIVVPFFESLPGSLPDAMASARGCVAADPALIAQIRANPGNYYVNLHDATFPAGAIRGQLRRGGGDISVPRQLTASLKGANEVPAADPDGRGRAFVSAKGDRVCFALTWEGIAQPVAGHIHRGAKGVNGPVVVPFPVFDGLPASFNGVDGCVSADPGLVDEIRHHPAGFYVNLHTPDFQGGAIRGQLKH
jgi:CHRD domain